MKSPHNTGSVGESHERATWVEAAGPGVGKEVMGWAERDRVGSRFPAEALQGAALPIDAVEILGDQVIPGGRKVEPLARFIGCDEAAHFPIALSEHFDALGALRVESFTGKRLGIIEVKMVETSACAGGNPGAIGEEDRSQRRLNPGRSGIAELLFAIRPEIEPLLSTVLHRIPGLIILSEAGPNDQVALRIIRFQIHPARIAAGDTDHAQGDARIGFAGSGVARGDDPLRLGNFINQSEDGDGGFIAAVEDEAPRIRTPPESFPVAAVDLFVIDPTAFAVQNRLGAVASQGPRGALIYIDYPKIIFRHIGDKASIRAELDQLLGLGTVGEAAGHRAIQLEVVDIPFPVVPHCGEIGIHPRSIQIGLVHGFKSREFFEGTPFALLRERPEHFAGAGLDDAKRIGLKLRPVAVLNVLLTISVMRFGKPFRRHGAGAAEIGQFAVLHCIKGDRFGEGPLRGQWPCRDRFQDAGIDGEGFILQGSFDFVGRLLVFFNQNPTTRAQHPLSARGELHENILHQHFGGETGLLIILQAALIPGFQEITFLGQAGKGQHPGENKAQRKESP